MQDKDDKKSQDHKEQASEKSNSSNTAERFLGLLRGIRVEAQYLEKALNNFQIEKSTANGSTQVHEIKDFQLLKKTFSRGRKRIEDHLASLGKLLDQDGEAYDYYGDEISHIVNLWDIICIQWDEMEKNNEISFESRKNIQKLLSLLDEIIYHSNLVTIPFRLGQHLDTTRIGQTLDFHQTFADEMPPLGKESQIHEQSSKILRYIYAHPEIIDGVVEVESGLIFKASSDLKRRMLSYLSIVMVIVGGALLFSFGIPYLGLHFKPQGWPNFTQEQLLGFYIFMVAGAAAHIGIDALKQFRENRGKGFVALDDCLLWIHVKELSLIAGAFSLWVVFLALVFLVDKVEWQVSLFAGYGADSVIDLFIQRFTSAARTRSINLTR